MPNTRSAIQEQCTRHILHRLGAIKAESKPYPHFSGTSFLPDDVYQQVLTSLPETALFDSSGYGGKRSNGEVNRFTLNLLGKNIERLPGNTREFWYGVRDAVGSPEVKRALFAKLAEGLAYRFGVAPEEAAEIPAFPQCTLLRESEGYFIKPHPDTRKKIATVQIALPEDDTQQDLGTSLYRLSPNPLRLLQEPRGFVEVGRYPFLPNSVFSFSVINSVRLKSWHGRTTLPPGCGIRNTLLVVYYADRADANPEIVEAQYGLGRAA